MSVALPTAEPRRLLGRDQLVLVAIWAVLITVPLWLPYVGGYTALAGRVLVFGLAAMALNLLLGFTGVLSFGHAAYFGLGAYGAGTDAALFSALHAARHAGRHAARRSGRHTVRPAHRAPAWRLLRHVHHRVRAAPVLPGL